MSLIYYSQCRQDEFLNTVVFDNKKQGFFIDIGAHDGKTFSNSLFFESANQWNGICVEPNPTVFAKLDSSRKSTNLNVCIGASNKTIKFTQIEGYAEMLSGISENYDERHIQRIDRDIESKGGKRNEIEVEMITLNSIESLKNQKIDFISIDTEGNEFDIVSSMDFNTLDVEAIVIENNYKDERIREFLSGFNFVQLYKLDFDDVYINKKYLSGGIRFRLKIWKLKVLLKRIINKLKSYTK
jgi:FkbM family methyltransferase